MNNMIADIVLNVKVHCLLFPDEPEYDSKMNEQDIGRLFVSVNTVWRGAGIRWKLHSCVKRKVDNPDARGFSSITKKREWRTLLGKISPITPLVLQKHIWNVCLMNAFPVASWGVYLAETQTVFLAEFSHLNRPNAVILSHEFGHMLGLHHVQYEGNLMNQRSLNNLQNSLYLSFDNIVPPLNQEQITNARKQAQLGPKRIDR
ncbi:Putative peptidase M10, metallopeptidase [Desulfamplus magnetovallimortis]|uniref:Putative peptidase M10, metallopeptidase n=1 Tax=Desulfamplus magnetovallimortis TaxID=1246637 RepID=L0R6L7_9BACT|nr:hypothetical protein [Desulfamplus magnetovallimortis]CCO06646.1 Putative peptidase M10, metallopeptidase [Desulfamplus magnetovallimortis BW-1]SLM32697.1 Putative peptidase M10, metallopeptidase [Desulfamplus magnetovallimortis]